MAKVSIRATLLLYSPQAVEWSSPRVVCSLEHFVLRGVASKTPVELTLLHFIIFLVNRINPPHSLYCALFGTSLKMTESWASWQRFIMRRKRLANTDTGVYPSLIYIFTVVSVFARLFRCIIGTSRSFPSKTLSKTVRLSQANFLPFCSSMHCWSVII